jgi:glutathione S-transferase
VLDDDGVILRDSQAILVYLARKFDAGGLWYLVDDAVRLAMIEAWHEVANRITATASLARLATGFYDARAPESAVAGAHLWFAEQQKQSWLCPGEHPTTSDIACFPYSALAGEGGIPLQDYPALRRWLDRVRRIKGFQTMSGVFPASPAIP